MQPPIGPRIEDGADGVVVTIRPRRSWGEIGFLSVWLAGWTFGGLAALAFLPTAGVGAALFVILWLCLWALGEAGAAVDIAWQLRGRLRVRATPSFVEVRKELGRFARRKRYEAPLITDVAAVLVPSDEDDGPRGTDYCVRITHRDGVVHVGDGLTAGQAEEVATRVLETIRPRAWWDADTTSRGVYVEPLPQPSRAQAIAGVLCMAGLGTLAVVASRF